MMGWYDHGMGWGGWVLMTLASLAFWAALIIGGIALWRATHSSDQRSTRQGSDAERLPDERFARVEIDAEDYRRRPRAAAVSTMTGVGPRTVVLAAASIAALTAATLTAVAATQGTSRQPGWNAPLRPGLAASSTCAVPAALPGAQVTVMLTDMGPGMMGVSYGSGGMIGGDYGGGWMMLRAVPHTVSAGTVSLIAVNDGPRTHELVVLPLAAGASVGARPVAANNSVDETGSLGEASKTCGSGSGDGITAGSAGWITLTLQPGRYELLCNLPGHYAAGMYTELDVT